MSLFLAGVGVVGVLAATPIQAQNADHVVTKWTCLTSSLAGPFAQAARAIPGCSAVQAAVALPLNRPATPVLPITSLAPPFGLNATVGGHTVMLTWTAPVGGDTPTSYIVQVGSASGLSDLANVDTGSALPRLTATEVPSGRYVVRVLARNASGTSASSNEVGVTVGMADCAGVPGAPSSLTQNVNGSTVSLSWLSPANCSPASYVIQVGSAPGTSDLANFSTGSAATSFSTSGVPSGVYYLRVAAVGSGGSGGPSNEVVIVINGCGAPPGAVTGLAYTVFGGSVSLTWTLPSGSPTGFYILVGSGPGRSDLAVTGTGGQYFLVDGVPAGTYYVRVLARNGCGSGGESNEVVITVESTVPVPATTVVSLHSFAGSPTDGSNLSTIALARDGNFYGTTVTGGPFNSYCTANLDGCGTAFRMTPSGALTILHVFGNDGAEPHPIYPYSQLTQGTDGNFYGTLTEGTPVYNRLAGGSAVFRMTPEGSVTILAPLGGASSSRLLEAPDGNFYGTTSYGSTGPDTAGFKGYGTVFRMTPAGAVTYLHAFTGGADGGNPFSGLVLASDGAFYSLTGTGGASNAGTIFKITADGTLTTLHTFSYLDGINPLPALIIGSDGNFYGTAQFGGGPANAGTVFRMTPAGDFTVLHVFTGVLTPDGAPPSRAASDGYEPVASLVQGPDGYYYGTTAGGGPHGGGTAYRIGADGAYTQIMAFAGNAEGSSPTSALVIGPDGAYYGTAQYGGLTNEGAIYKLLVR